LNKTTIILGPPGTGKTTKLLSITDKFLSSGVHPSEICFLTFTKKAAEVAMYRAIDKFNLSPTELPYFKTLHSLAFMQLQLDRKSVMSYGNYITLAQSLGISISFKMKSEDGTFAGFEKGDRMMFMENLARVSMKSLKDYWEEQPNDGFEYRELEQLHVALKQFKEVNGKMDFTDMIIRFVKEKPVPKFRKLIIDEAQDLSRCQWEMVHVLMEVAEETYIAGDDDQAIFRWAGADVDHLINLPGKVEVLGQSYRVPKTIANLANSVIANVTHRREKMWRPKEEPGEVHDIGGIDMLDMSEGTWLLLARNGYMLAKYEEYCTMQGYLFTSPSGSLLRGPAWEAVRIWEKLRAGKSVLASDALKVYEYMNVRERVAYGGKGPLKAIDKATPTAVVTIKELKDKYGLRTEAIWHEALDRLPAEDRDYFLAALRRGEKVNREPRIRISTIHASKGGEAENVVILKDMATRTYNEYLDNPEDEARVWYVALTRASKALWIIQAQSNRYYDLG
jgi:DNA helicase II / ATP-dependent DNA helicase PcrA